MDAVASMLPSLLDPLFDLLEDNLPPTLYQLLLQVLSHTLALSSTAIRLVGSLIAKDPQEWDLQTVLPPVVTLLAAYLALASLYRTTSWLFRLSFWFIKWGSLLGAFCVGAGWLAALNTMNGDANGALENLGSKAVGWLNGNGNVRGPRFKTRPRTATQKNKRPWTKFDKQGNPRPRDANVDEAQKVMQNIVESANQVFDSSWWWQVGKVMVGQGQEAKGPPQRQQDGRTRSR